MGGGICTYNVWAGSFLHPLLSCLSPALTFFSRFFLFYCAAGFSWPPTFSEKVVGPLCSWVCGGSSLVTTNKWQEELSFVTMSISQCSWYIHENGLYILVFTEWRSFRSVIPRVHSTGSRGKIKTLLERIPLMSWYVKSILLLLILWSLNVNCITPPALQNWSVQQLQQEITMS